MARKQTKKPAKKQARKIGRPGMNKDGTAGLVLHTRFPDSIIKLINEDARILNTTPSDVLRQIAQSHYSATYDERADRLAEFASQIGLEIKYDAIVDRWPEAEPTSLVESEQTESTETVVEAAPAQAAEPDALEPAPAN